MINHSFLSYNFTVDLHHGRRYLYKLETIIGIIHTYVYRRRKQKKNTTKKQTLLKTLHNPYPRAEASRIDPSPKKIR